MAAVQIGDRLEFYILLSMLPTLSQALKPTSKDLEEPRLKYVTSSFMKDIATMNMAFTFGFNGSARNVALWTHQSVLEQQPNLSSLMSKLKDVDGDLSSTDAISGVKTTHVTEYSLESYCALIRYLYCGQVQLEVDLDDFAIGSPPNKPFSPSCKNRPIIVTKVPSRRYTTWEELFQIADCYQVSELREYYLDKIVEVLDTSTALDVLFRYAYRYPDLKATALQHVANSMTELYSKSKDPFSAYAEHPQRHELMSEALYLVFTAKAHIREP
ncbi:hypothetical protein BGZ82_005283 [Podila clonocystis]|nr:hypothetical protein BGZ82_005283 [Podila clonocystis]